ncbi:MAG: pilus assembly protein, partial [Schwartzia sp.]|nr:pilus assembly protein [Schwartzia sp. (in: firmicutes)]
MFTALALWFLLMFVAFAVDFGNYYQHKTRLQNAADAAALAGVAKYAEESKNNSAVSTTTSKGRLVKLPSDSNVSSFSSGSYSFNKEAGNVSDTVHASAKGYVMSNYVQNDSTHNGVSMFDSIWSATGDATESKETNGITTKITTVTPKSYCYRIDLTDTIPTFFARIFGKDSLEVSVSAMAMLDRKDTEETTDITAEDVLMQIAQNLSAIAPNYFWETITYNKKGAYTISGKEITAFTADEKKRNRYVTGDKVDT